MAGSGWDAVGCVRGRRRGPDGWWPGLRRGGRISGGCNAAERVRQPGSAWDLFASGIEEVVAGGRSFLTGGVVAGKSFSTGEPFDVGRASDPDWRLSAKIRRVRACGGKTNGPAAGEAAKALGLNKLQQTLPGRRADQSTLLLRVGRSFEAARRLLHSTRMIKLGIKSTDLNSAAEALARALHVSFVRHESDFRGGDYFRAETKEGTILLQTNYDPVDRESFEAAWPRDQLVLYFNGLDDRAWDNLASAATTQCDLGATPID